MSVREKGEVLASDPIKPSSSELVWTLLFPVGTVLALIVSANAVSAGLAAVSDRYPDCETLINGLVRALVLSLSITLAFVALALSLIHI